MIKKIKDLLYNKNDVVIVLAILAVAGLLIWNRIDVIMDYPSNLIAKSNADSELQDQPDVIIVEPDLDEEPADEVVMYAVYINPGETPQEIGQKFVDVGLFASVEAFVQLVNDMGVATTIKAGNFIMPSNSTPEEVIQTIVTPGI
jgi:hypothetical protein